MGPIKSSWICTGFGWGYRGALKMEATKRYWVGFNLVKGIGAVRLQRLLDFFGDARAAWEASPAKLVSAGLPARQIKTLLQVRATIDLDQLWDFILEKQIAILTWLDEGYPPRLREIDHPPPVLYLRGQLVRDDTWSVAVVGTRRITRYGRQVTEEIVGTLVQSGVTVVSGLARGVDTIAHKAALSGGGRTLAVLGCGVDLIYPPENRRLAEEIIRRGGLISDYPPGTPPEAMNFPPRNRIISGLALAVVVVEAGRKSGALITAGFAADQGREVFAVPGSVQAPQSKGTNLLIQRGAQPLLDPQDVLEALDLSMALEHKAARVALPSEGLESELLALIRREPLHVDEISRAAAVPVARVSATLAMLELKGLVRQVGGMHYVAV